MINRPVEDALLVLVLFLMVFISVGIVAGVKHEEPMGQLNNCVLEEPRVFTNFEHTQIELTQQFETQGVAAQIRETLGSRGANFNKKSGLPLRVTYFYKFHPAENNALQRPIKVVMQVGEHVEVSTYGDTKFLVAEKAANLAWRVCGTAKKNP